MEAGLDTTGLRRITHDDAITDMRRDWDSKSWKSQFADTSCWKQAIGSNPDALRMQRVVNFYEKLPRGPAPEVKATGLLGRYQAKHFGKNPSGKRTLSFYSGSPWTDCFGSTGLR